MIRLATVLSGICTLVLSDTFIYSIFSFPFFPVGVDEKGMTAASLLELVNLNGISITSISFFESGAWKPGLSVDIAKDGALRGRDFDCGVIFRMFLIV